MKKLYFFLFASIFANIVNAQIVNIPDFNFKQRIMYSDPNSTIAKDLAGNYFKIDANNDGLIQVSEALAVSYLDLNSGTFGDYISDLTGIQYFTNLKKLICKNNTITTIDLTSLVNLEDLDCRDNYCTSLYINGLSNLKTALCQNNNMVQLDLTGLPSLTDINIDACSDLASINPSLCPNLKTFSFYYVNHLPSLNFSNLPYLEFIAGLSGATLISITAVNLPSLRVLWCDNSNVGTLQLSNLNNLEELHCNHNHLTNLNLLGMNKLKILDCAFNQLTGNLFLSDKPDLTKLKCNDNNFTGLFIKNGYTGWTTYDIFFYNNPNFHYLCCEDSLLNFFRNEVISSGMIIGSVEINSYCSFAPGGLNYTIAGTATYDMNNNGCDTSDDQANLTFLVSNGVSSSTVTGLTGNYGIAVSAGNYTITPLIENPFFFTITPTVFAASFPTQASPAVQNICITPNGIHHDVAISLIPLSRARPGFDVVYKIVYKNKGNQIQSGTISLAFNDANLDFVVSNPTFSSQIINYLNWNFSNLHALESREIILTLNLNSVIELPPVNSGDVLNFTASINDMDTDETPNDNTFALHQTVVNSFDPNDKTCLEGNTITPEMVGKEVHYMIRFENTGTTNAENIVVKDMIDTAKFDVNSLIPIDGSAPFTTRINGNKVEFIFQNINLPFNNANNDGYVAFKIKTKPTLVLGNTFSNTASIYFDYNAPIVTNTATTTVAVLAAHDFVFENYFSIYPNPADTVLNIDSKKQIEVTSISIYNTLGQLLIVIPNAKSAKTVDVSGLKTGNYFIKINSDKGSSNAKFIKL